MILMMSWSMTTVMVVVMIFGYEVYLFDNCDKDTAFDDSIVGDGIMRYVNMMIIEQ